jgi:hypothetical protein
MGGKDGGGGGGGDYSDQAMTARGIDVNRLRSDQSYFDKVQANGFMSAPQEDPPPAKAAAPAPAPEAPAPAPEAPAPDPVTPDPVGPTGPLIGTGGGINQPTSAGNPAAPVTGGVGDALGGAVTAPPKYWVGGLDRYAPSTGSSGRGGGSIKTTQQ